MRILPLLLCCFAAACAAPRDQQNMHEPSSGFDPALAQKLGADERGMRPYVLVILKTGVRADFTEAQRTELFHGHIANIKRLSKEGRLAAAGPFEPNDRQYRGVFILTVETVEEASKIAASDPAVAAGVFAYEAFPWYGPAGLMELPSLQRRLEKPPAP
ncbi:MAG: YciI family protein [Caulobacterales bacterium]